MVSFFKQFGMEPFDIREIDIHGGSIRIFVGRRGRWPHQPSVEALIQREEHARIYEIARLNEFARAVEANRDMLRELVYGLKHQGAKIAAVSAPAKGMTLLNYARFGTDVIDFATEKSPLKIGRYTPGAHIPVVADAELERRKADYALLLAWNFADEIMRNLQSYTDGGGRFIVPIPTPRLVEAQR
jgi:hypothetical protein